MSDSGRVVRCGLALLFGLALSVAGFQVGVLVADAIHLPSAIFTKGVA